jgi:hypothetical protein
MENEKHILPRIVLVDNTEADRLLQKDLEAKGRQSSVAVKRSKLGNMLIRFTHSTNSIGETDNE